LELGVRSKASQTHLLGSRGSGFTNRGNELLDFVLGLEQRAILR